MATIARKAAHILVRHGGEMVDIATADPRTILAVRHETLGYVSQFLRVVPRVSALDVVAEVLLARGIDRGARAARESCCFDLTFRRACTRSRRRRSRAVSSSV